MLAKPNLYVQFKRFVDMLKKIYINIPYSEALSQIPLYAKILKYILKLPPKLEDPGSFSIPCVIGKETIEKTMCDVGATVSLLPLSLFKRFGIGELKPTKMTLQLANRSIIYPAGILEDIPIKVGKIYIPADFVVVDIEEDFEIPILLGRPFFATVGAVIDVKNDKIVFHVGDEKVALEIANLMKGPSVFVSCCMIDDHCVKERFLASSGHYDLFDPF